MAADVVFTEGDPWYTNSYSWNQITDHAMEKLKEPLRDEYEWHINVTGIDFTSMPDKKAVEISTWLAEIMEEMLTGPEASWTGEADRRHAEVLIRKLHEEAQLRSHVTG
jgi:hypothetical protein